ncbi:MAG: response regulator transcription factor [Anaerolineae bacterium]|jgi:two-component system alkaline phosphatase synthesis response regulator PhoP|nr:response regulator transcription factor [Anaerolineae bacterium]
MAARILVVDDDPKIVRLIQSYLERAGWIVLSAADGHTATYMIRRERPDLIVLDIMLPGQDGWQITRFVRNDPHLAATPILMLTARIEDTDKIKGLELGADDYLVKPFNPEEVVARVRAILRRVRMEIQPPRVLQSGDLRLDVDQHSLTLNGAPIEITPTEFALLKTLMQAPNRSFTRSELIEQALGYHYEGMERTLDSHIKNLRKKIEPDEPRYIETVFGVGYRFREDRP